MLIINKLQKLIYNQLANSNKENIKKLKNIVSTSIINSDFPYLIIDINNLEIDKNFANDYYIVNIKIKIFDKNESNSNIINISSDIFMELSDLNNIYINNARIIDINLLNTELNLFNEINSIWSCNLNFKITIENII